MQMILSNEKSGLPDRFGYDLGAPRHPAAFGAVRGPLLHDLRAQARQYHTGDGGYLAAEAEPPSRFEQLASRAAGISPQRVRLLGILLAAASPAACGGRPVLRPVWATEALHRAYNSVRLLGRLQQRAPQSEVDTPSPDFETRLGIRLAATFDRLAIIHDEEPRPCSSPLRDVVRDLVELFGPAVGRITAVTAIDRLALPAFQQRALVLLANELVTNCLLHAFGDRRTGRIAVQLSLHQSGSASLTVTDDGYSDFAGARRQHDRCAVSDYLADLLESELVYRPNAGGGTIAEIEIPASTAVPI